MGGQLAENHCKTQRIILEERGAAAQADWLTARLEILSATAEKCEEPAAVFRKAG